MGADVHTIPSYAPLRFDKAYNMLAPLYTCTLYK